MRRCRVVGPRVVVVFGVIGANGEVGWGWRWLGNFAC